jgi:fatty-acyl-CoA synthase
MSGSQAVALREETIGANLARTVGAWPAREALVSCAEGVRMTWAQFDASVDRVARGLLGAGLRTGDRLGIWSPNRHEWTLVQYAAARLGVILVNINPAYRTGELVFALRQSGCRMLVAAESFKTSDYRAMVAEARGELPALARVVFLGTADWVALLAEGDGVDPAEVAAVGESLSATDPINIQYTSGTTGFPKGATLTHRNILNNGFFVGEACGYTEEDRVCIPVPFYHCFGMVMGNLGPRW